ncbi:PGPGW domain-containing protein [Nocardioides sp.]|uniref:PGPGW domain-containing protein n=1 Tax=Nocardioides sp. TaxID=35761 RepID=UPI000C930F99|nr:PGPGW domain-containing protein [Nocardioides sp.]MAS54165.1 hypothetical protein [Pimelobacter sp.]MDE0777560.1 PGPGW domain-containing protein [Nocardioides sp.]
MSARLRAWALTTLGWALTAVGIVLFPLPGPGLLVMVVGLALLAEQHAWAARWVDRLKDRAVASARHGVATTWRATWSVAGSLVLAASGLLWLWAPSEPAWWLLPSWTWLPGGWWAGVSQVLSGLVTLALVLDTYRRVHHGDRPEHLVG